jgi:hypothetical protein
MRGLGREAPTFCIAWQLAKPTRLDAVNPGVAFLNRKERRATSSKGSLSSPAVERLFALALQHHQAGQAMTIPRHFIIAIARINKRIDSTIQS